VVSRDLTEGRAFPVASQPHGCRHRSATMRSANSHQLMRKGKSMTIVFVGIYLAVTTGQTGGSQTR
jgi:hypothetical protein